MLYCSSSKCQIIHWRQGHKDECCPSIITVPLKEESNSYRILLSQTQADGQGNGFDLKILLYYLNHH